MGTAELVVVVAAFASVVLVALVLLVQVLVRSRRRRRARAVDAAAAAGQDGGRPPPLPAVVLNPSKFEDVGPLKEAVERVAASTGWARPLWLETTPDDPGIGMTREALAAGADVVLACGGDGTVRCVGQVLAGTGVPMGLVPAGTGNLLARNLNVVTPRTAELSPGDAEAATRLALTGEDRAVDVGWVTVVGADGDEKSAPSERAFLVMAGMGFDAAIMANAPEALKARVGQVAYVVSGLQHFNGKRASVTITVDGVAHHRRVRTVVIGNVGRLLGGLSLMPDAEVDDGWLDVVAIGPRNVAQWLDVLGRVVARHRRGDARLEFWRARDIVVRTTPALPAQLDGDPVGDAVELRMRVDEHALLVRVAPGSGVKAEGGAAQPAAATPAA